MTTLTKKQAYLAMFAFLEAEYELSKSDEIGALLGSLSFVSDEQPADPAVKEQWKNAVEQAVRGVVNANLNLKNSEDEPKL